MGCDRISVASIPWRFTMHRRFASAVGVLVAVASIAAFSSHIAAESGKVSKLSEKAILGKQIFFDTALSSPPGQSCATCHDPKAGFNGNGDAKIAVYEGAVKGRFGNRNPPASAYASFSPKFHLDKKTGEYVGGQFWDGRAATLEAQAKGPFLNPAEQNLEDAKALVEKVCQASYGKQFIKLFGKIACTNPTKGYDKIAEAVAVYEGSTESNRFSSKYDLFLAGKTALSEAEKRGFELFNGKGKCSSCHPSAKGPKGNRPVFTDFTYDNIGIPKNPANPHYTTTKELNPQGLKYIDLGLGQEVKDAKQNGKFKVPTLRNVAVAPPYGHNGYFKTLDEVIRFYNTRDIPKKWPAPEVTENLNKNELGNLGLTETEIADIVAFLQTLTDGYQPPVK
jgi:cytochrome c peroxidase